MKLNRQFAILTLAAAASSLIVYGAMISTQLLGSASREPLRQLVLALAEVYERRGAFPAEEIDAAVDALDVSSTRFVILSPAMELLYSGMAASPAPASGGEAGSFSAYYSLFRRSGRKTSLQVIPIVKNLRSETPLLVVDPEPWNLRAALRARILLLASLLAGALLLATGAISLLMLRTLRRNITALIEGTGRIAGGELDYELSLGSRDEFRDLADSINSMRISLQGAMRRQSLLFMGMSHDMKTPVSLICGYADALDEGMDDGGKERGRYLGIIKAKARQLEEIIDEFISLIRLESGSRIAERERMRDEDLPELVAKIAKRLGDDAALMGRRFRFEAPAAEGPSALPPPAIRMKRLLFERLLENLFSNAIRFGAPEGEILLSFAPAPGKGWVLSLCDEGPGIPPEDLPWVFDPFYRGSRSREDGGMGLGLAFARAIADLHGWELDLGPRPDGRRGTCARLAMREPASPNSENTA